MPNINSAKKKLRQDIKQTQRNQAQREQIKKITKLIRTGKIKDVKEITKAHSMIDKAAKKRIIHKNKAARLKSSVSKLGSKK